MSRMDVGAEGFSHSPFMRFLGLEIIKAEKGRVEIRLPFRQATSTSTPRAPN